MHFIIIVYGSAYACFLMISKILLLTKLFPLLISMKSTYETKEAVYALLRKEVEETFGKKIGSSRDCHMLSEEVYTKISFNINSNTLRRIFGLVKSHYSPSLTTLDILSKFCGFASFDEFKKLQSTTHKVSHEDFYSSSVLKYMVALFRDTSTKEFDKTFAAVVKHTIHFIQRHPELCDKFQRAIAKTKNGQEYYYEQCIHIDALNSFYGDGLRFYLIEKNKPEAQVFGHSLLCLKNWLSENTSEVIKHHDEVVKHTLTNNSHPMLCGRFFATRLLFADIQGLPIEKILIQAQQRHALIREQSDGYRIFPYFESVISPILLLTGHPEEALYFIDYSLNNYPHKHAHIDPGIYQTMDLIRALTLFKTGRIKEAEKLFHLIRPSKFYFLSQKTSRIMYLFLSQYLKKSSVTSDDQLKDLIAKMGFTRLNQVLHIER